jgi:hypothetical protein
MIHYIGNCVNDIQKFSLIANIDVPLKSPKKISTKNGKPPKTTRKVGKTIGCRIFNYMFT